MSSAYTDLAVFVFLLCGINASTVKVILNKENSAPKNVDFLNVIKQDLKRNNEDYEETSKKLTALQNQSATQSVPKLLKPLESIDREIKAVRRKFDDTEEEEDYGEDTTKATVKTHSVITTTTRRTTKISKDVRKMQKKIRSSKNKKIFNISPIQESVHRLSVNKKEIILPTSKPSNGSINTKIKIDKANDQIPKFVNKNKIDKFKKFMAKNKDLLKEFISNKLETTTQKMQTEDTSKKNINQINKALRNAIYDVGRKRYKKKGELPDPHLLDMAPAKGGRIFKKRNRGQLCHRHVLMPEGPKYDSKGQWYVPAHALIVRRPYDVTRAPKLLLPKCCNCCKKSVLGCE